MGSVEFLAGRIVKPNPNGTTRWNLSGGLGYTRVTKYVNWTRVDGYSIGRNYTYDTVDKGTVSLILSPKVEFPFTQIFGLTISLNLQVNTETVYVGVGFGAMLGLLRKADHPKVTPVY